MDPLRNNPQFGIRKIAIASFRCTMSIIEGSQPWTVWSNGTVCQGKCKHQSNSFSLKNFSSAITSIQFLTIFGVKKPHVGSYNISKLFLYWPYYLNLGGVIFSIMTSQTIALSAARRVQKPTFSVLLFTRFFHFKFFIGPHLRFCTLWRNYTCKT